MAIYAPSPMHCIVQLVGWHRPELDLNKNEIKCTQNLESFKLYFIYRTRVGTRPLGARPVRNHPSHWFCSKKYVILKKGILFFCSIWYTNSASHNGTITMINNITVIDVHNNVNSWQNSIAYGDSPIIFCMSTYVYKLNLISYSATC